MKQKGYFCLEVNATRICNMKCQYCFEFDKTPETEKIDHNLIMKRIDELLEDEWFNDRYCGIKIDFWGGEPTLNPVLIKTLIEKYVKNPKVLFHIYTNGYQMDGLYNILKTYKDYKKFSIQFSYDGQPIHDIRRKDKKNNTTSEVILKNMERFVDLGFPISLKSTIMPRDFKYMPIVWDDFRALYDKYNNKKRFQYNPTIDQEHFNSNFYYEDFEKAILEIGRKELDFYRENNTHLMSWFQGLQVFCSAGKNMATVDTDGNVYFCHGIIYNELKKQDLKITNIELNTFVKDIQNNCEKADLWKVPDDVAEQCKNCSATMCMKCNARKYEHSTKTKINEKWMDFTTQPEICNYFKIFGRINRAIKKIILEER